MLTSSSLYLNLLSNRIKEKIFFSLISYESIKNEWSLNKWQKKLKKEEGHNVFNMTLLHQISHLISNVIYLIWLSVQYIFILLKSLFGNKLFFSLLFLLLVIVPSLPTIMFLYILMSPKDFNNVRHLLEIHNYRTAIAVRDAGNNLIGLINPLENNPFSSNVENDRKPSNVKDDRQPSLFVTDTKTKDDVFWKVLKYREGKGINFESEEPFGYYKGIYLFPQISMISHHGGGSTPMNLIAKQLYGEKYFEEHRDECPWYLSHYSSFCRKYIETSVARDLYDYLAEHDGTEFKRWISMHVPLVTNVGGDSFGIQAAAAILFAKKPEELSAGEQALLATAYKKPLMLTGNFQLDKIKETTINAYICERKYVCNEEFEEPEFTECKSFFKDKQIKENSKRCDELWNRDVSTHKALTGNINPEYRWLFNAFKARKFVMTDELFTLDQQK